MREISPYLRDSESLQADAPWGQGARFFAEEEEGLNLRVYWQILHKHLKLILTIVAGAVTLTWLVALNMTRLYTAKSTLLIEPNVPKVLDITELMGEPPGADEHDYYQTQYEILKSRSLAAEVIRDLNLQANPLFGAQKHHAGLIAGWWSDLRLRVADLVGHSANSKENVDQEEVDGVKPEVIDAYLKRLDIEPQWGTRLVVVEFTTPDPVLSARIVNDHNQAYIRQGIELHVQASSNAREFLEKQLPELKQRVEKSEAALNSYRRARGIVTFSLHDKGTLIMQRLTELTTSLSQVQATRIELEAQHELIGQGRYEALPAAMSDLVVEHLREEVAQLSAQYASMSNRFNPGYHSLDDLKAKLDESRARLHNELRTVAGSVELAYDAAVSREARLKSEIAQVKDQAMALNDASLQDAVLAREVDSNRQLYAHVLSRMQQIHIAGQVATSNVSVVDRAEAPILPSSPKVLLDLVISGFFALAAALGFVFVVEHLDDSFRSPEEIERQLRLPKLGLVPDFAKLAESRRRTAAGLFAARSGPRPARAVECQPNGADSKELVASPNHLSLVGDVYRMIRAALLFSRAGGPPKTILISSALPSEGKTVTAVNTALVFAYMEGRTLLVDADLQHGRCHQILGIDNHLGLTDALVGQGAVREFIRPTAVGGLSLLSSGSVPPNPADLLASARMRDLLAELSHEYDFVLMDSPPVNLVSDALSIATMVDGVLLVVGAKTSSRMAREACSRLRQVGAKVFGAVLNQVDITRPGQYDYYSRHSYYSR
jgi:polysaccharide biosynthesis transport protein